MSVRQRAGSILREETWPTLRLAGPVVLGQLGMMLMGLVDTRMVAQLGEVSIGAVAIGSAAQYLLMMSGQGLLLGLDRLASVAVGGRRWDELRRVHVQGQWLALFTGVVVTAVALLVAGEFPRFVTNPDVAREAGAWLRMVSFGFIPAMLFTANRQVLQAMDDVRAASILLILANVVNVAGNVAFIGGWGPVEAMGAAGSGLATSISRVFLWLALLGYTAWRGVGGPADSGAGSTPPPAWSFALDRRVLGDMVRLGLPGAGHLSLEVAVFAIATITVEKMGTVALAAHQVVLMVSSFTFMVPLGLSFAGAVRVGQAAGRGDAAGAKRAGWAAVLLAVGFMACAGLFLSLVGAPLVRMFGVDEDVVALGARLIIVAALFQSFDGAQVSLAGVLRGAGETKATMWANLFGHWCVGFPVGLLLGFGLGFGPVGLWAGLALGLASVALLLGRTWWRRTPEVPADVLAASA